MTINKVFLSTHKNNTMGKFYLDNITLGKGWGRRKKGKPGAV
jgi:hypothetical protein